MDQSVASINCNTEKENNPIFREERLNVLFREEGLDVLFAQHTH